MPTMMSEFPETVTPTEEEARQAQESSRRLAQLLESGRPDARFRIQEDHHPEEAITIPLSALRLLADILTEMAQGNAVSVIPVRTELTTQQAADLLHVSRPFLIRLLEEGKLPFRLVGGQRRVRFDDLMAYKQQDDEARRRLAEQLTAEAQELGMGY
jgi:excisionase family DNA binding protein